MKQNKTMLHGKAWRNCLVPKFLRTRLAAALHGSFGCATAAHCGKCWTQAFGNSVSGSCGFTFWILQPDLEFNQSYNQTATLIVKLDPHIVAQEAMQLVEEASSGRPLPSLIPSKPYVKIQNTFDLKSNSILLIPIQPNSI